MPWIEKYKPKDLKEFVNQREAVEVFLEWIKKWKPGTKALLFYGMPGIGKTALVEAFCKERNFDFIQMNASDYRSAKRIREVLGRSMLQRTLFKNKLFFIDEADGLSGREDRGGVGEMIKIIKSSQYPIILTANNPYDPKLRYLRNYCKLVEFRKISVWDIEKRLRQICNSEKIEAVGEVLRKLAKMSDGDLRSAINDLETIARGRTRIEEKDLEILGYREREINIFEVLKIIFKTKDALTAKLAIRNLDMDPDTLFWWIENNITNEYEEPEEIAEAFDALSKADVFRQRIISRQNWRFRAYMTDLMTGGVAVAKKRTYRKFTRYHYPKNIALLGQMKARRASLDRILSKLSSALHCSRRKVRAQFLPFLRLMFRDRRFSKQLAHSLDLAEDELSVGLS